MVPLHRPRVWAAVLVRLVHSFFELVPARTATNVTTAHAATAFAAVAHAATAGTRDGSEARRGSTKLNESRHPPRAGEGREGRGASACFYSCRSRGDCGR